MQQSEEGNYFWNSYVLWRQCDTSDTSYALK